MNDPGGRRERAGGKDGSTARRARPARYVGRKKKKETRIFMEQRDNVQEVGVGWPCTVMKAYKEEKK